MLHQSRVDHIQYDSIKVHDWDVRGVGNRADSDLTIRREVSGTTRI